MGLNSRNIIMGEAETDEQVICTTCTGLQAMHKQY